ncbi:MAG TPA: hypothetical protein VFF63_05655, partial [Candidatus Babeliales bacterium]|nr:hypothetical protein [Candidatus Babeliales bacterium]
MKPFRGIGIIAVATLIGCSSGPQSQLAPWPPLQYAGEGSSLGQLSHSLANAYVSGAARPSVPAAHPGRHSSWIDPDAAAKDLLYVSNYN